MTADPQLEAIAKRHGWKIQNGIMMPKVAVRKPVVSIPNSDTSKMWTFEYQAKRYEPLEILASDSLANLKRQIQRRGWKLAWLTMKTGSFSYGQNVVGEYPYQPRQRKPL